MDESGMRQNRQFKNCQFKFWYDFRGLTKTEFVFRREILHLQISAKDWFQVYLKQIIMYRVFILMVSLFLPVVFFGIVPPQETGLMGKISEALNVGDASKLATHFNTAVDLTIPGNDGLYSKKQAEQIVKAFWVEQPVQSFKMDHKGTSNDGSQYMIGTLKISTGKVFRVYILIKNGSSEGLIQQLQFEEE